MTTRRTDLPDEHSPDMSACHVLLLTFMAITLVIGTVMLSGRHSQAEPLGTGTTYDPANKAFGMTNPVTSSMQATENFETRLLEQQHRFQANSNRRQLRPKRPEPGEVEVTREEDMVLSDPLRSTLKDILPRDR